MIQPLRVAHRRALVGLAVVLPAILWIGLSERSSQPGASAHIADVPPNANVIRQSSNLWQNHTIQSTFYSRSDRPQEIDVVLQSTRDLNTPDLLLYWTGDAPEGQFLSDGAKLLGAFKTGGTYLIPLHEERAGYLVLFSSAHQSVFDTARVEKLP